ncbi:hypothetical protein TNCT_108421 [Trichonephila clavata]|uniref:ATP-dependent DNA helicase n=1 Tax=Trichonephila clavata TaxID=2740835 RepID=A0A8X6H2S1_TRICU|nr:hypothetical protein TNCT_108421 [Trichonephila clavata]
MIWRRSSQGQGTKFQFDKAKDFKLVEGKGSEFVEDDAIEGSRLLNLEDECIVIFCYSHSYEKKGESGKEKLSSQKAVEHKRAAEAPDEKRARLQADQVAPVLREQLKLHNNIKCDSSHTIPSSYDVQALLAYMAANVPRLTPDQQQAFIAITEMIGSERGGIFILDAPGGTDKTFILNLLLAFVKTWLWLLPPLA